MGNVPNSLVLRFGAFGDLVMLTSMLRGLHARLGAPCDVVAGVGLAPRVLAGLECVGEVRTISSRRRPYVLSPDQRALVRWMRARRGGGPVFVVETVERNLPKVRWLVARGGADPARLVTPLEVPRRPLEHAVDWMARLAAHATGDDRPPPPPRLAVSDDERRDVAAWLARRGAGDAPIVVVQTESRRVDRGRWPAERWVAAIRGVLDASPEARVLLAGTPAERPRVLPLVAACRDPRVEEAASDLPLRRLFALLERAHSCLSLDTGPAHAAAALGCPTVVLLGSADPRRNRPIGEPGRVRVVASIPESAWPDSPYDWPRANRMEAIEVDAVLDAWRALGPASRDAAPPR